MSVNPCFAQNRDSVLVASDKPILGEGTYKVSLKEVNKTGRVEKLPGSVYLKNGKIFSSFSELNGFPKVTYIASLDSAGADDRITFTAESTKSNGEVLKWEGTIVGDKISGKAFRNFTGSTYYFEGKLN